MLVIKLANDANTNEKVAWAIIKLYLWIFSGLLLHCLICFLMLLVFFFVVS